MTYLTYSTNSLPGVELNQNSVLMLFYKPLLDNIHIKINGKLTCESVLHSAVSMAVNNASVHSISNTIKELLVKHQ